MFPNLNAEMKRHAINVKMVSELLEVSEKTVENKIRGRTKFFLAEASKIRDAYFEGLRIEYLFLEQAS